MCTTDDSNIYNFRSCCCCNNGKIICDYQQAGSRIYMYMCIWWSISHIPNPISTVECNVAKDKQTAVGKDNEKKLQAKCARVREFPVEQTHKQNAKEKPAKIIKIIIKKPPHYTTHTHTGTLVQHRVYSAREPHEVTVRKVKIHGEKLHRAASIFHKFTQAPAHTHTQK